MKKIIIAVAMATASTIGLSAANPRVAEAPRIVVTASRLDQPLDEMPSYVEVLSREDIVDSGATNLAELLRTKTTSLNLISPISGNPAFATVAPAGYGENGWGRILLMVDGQRLNNPDMAAPLLSQVDLGSVNRIEILHGSQAVLHGDGASAGALNIVTEPDDYEPHRKIEAHAGSWGSYGTQVSYRDGDEEEGTKWWANGGWQRSRGHRENDSWQIWNLSGGIKKEWAKGSYLRLSMFHNDSTYDLPGSAENPTPRDWARRTTTGLNTTLNGVINDEHRIKVDFLTSMSRNRSVWASSNARLVQDIYAYELTPQWITTTPLGRFENEFILGTTYRLEQSYHYAHAHRHTLAAFAKNTFHLTQTLAIEAGLRGQRTMNENLWAGDLALLFEPVEEVKTYLRGSRFFRCPFLDETMFISPFGLPRPEYGIGINLGAEWRLYEDFTAFIDTGFSQTTNEIYYDPSTYSNLNAPDDVHRKTVTLGFKWEREKVAELSLGCTYTDASFNGGAYDNKRVPFVSTVTAQVSGRLWLWEEFSLLAGYTFQSSRYTISDFENTADPMPSVSRVQLGCRYEPRASWLEGFYLSIMIHNLFDRDYDEYAVSGWQYASYPAPGRCLMLTFGWEF